MFYYLIIAALFTYYFNDEINTFINEINKFLILIHSKNPLLLDYYSDEEDEENEDEENEEEDQETEQKELMLYENKYMNKYKNLPFESHTDEFLNKLINNYIIEMTPIGNVIMRYNNDKKSFEYFSNNAIPFRYLETISRKYVIVYNCRDIFIDLEKEVEEANQINEKIKDMKIKPKMKVNVNLTTIMKDYKASNAPLPQLEQPFVAVKNSNRYTHQGRFSDFKIIKSVKRSEVDKSLKLSFKDWSNSKKK